MWKTIAFKVLQVILKQKCMYMYLYNYISGRHRSQCGSDDCGADTR